MKFPLDWDDKEMMDNPPAPLVASKMEAVRGYTQHLLSLPLWSNRQLDFARANKDGFTDGRVLAARAFTH